MSSLSRLPSRIARNYWQSQLTTKGPRRAYIGQRESPKDGAPALRARTNKGGIYCLAPLGPFDSFQVACLFHFKNTIFKKFNFERKLLAFSPLAASCPFGAFQTNKVGRGRNICPKGTLFLPQYMPKGAPKGQYMPTFLSKRLSKGGYDAIRQSRIAFRQRSQ